MKLNFSVKQAQYICCDRSIPKKHFNTVLQSFATISSYFTAGQGVKKHPIKERPRRRDFHIFLCKCTANNTGCPVGNWFYTSVSYPRVDVEVGSRSGNWNRTQVVEVSEGKKNRVGLARNQWCRMVEGVRSRSCSLSPFRTSGHSSSVIRVGRFYFLGNCSSWDSCIPVWFFALSAPLEWYAWKCERFQFSLKRNRVSFANTKMKLKE